MKVRCTPEILRAMTEWLRTPSGTQELWPVQGESLLQLAVYGRLFATARVGGGKTWIAALAPTVCKAERPLIVVPAHMREETSDHIDEARRHWQIRPGLKVISYNKISNSNFLEEYRPDLIIADEAHRLKRVRKSACARKTARYVVDTKTRFAALTGSPVREGFLDYAHLMVWSLGEYAPVPHNPDIQAKWAACLDDASGRSDTWQTPDYSVLEPILGPIAHNQAAARAAFRELQERTPGIVVSTDVYSDVGLCIRPIHLPAPEVLDQVWTDLRTDARLPDDWLLPDKTGVWAAAQQFALGFYYGLDPRPEEDWLAARKEWCRFCRRVLEDSVCYDTETDVRDACIRGDLPDHAWRVWAGIKDAYDPAQHRVTCWLSDHALAAAERWGREGGIVWTNHVAFAEALAERTGWPYYGEEGVDAATRVHIRHATAPTIIASAPANSEGRNLQVNCGPDGRGYYRNLFTVPPAKSLDWEQRVARTHRYRQTRDVEVDYFVGCREQYVALATAIESATMSTETLSQQPKLIQDGVSIQLPSEAWIDGPSYQ